MQLYIGSYIPTSLKGLMKMSVATKSCTAYTILHRNLMQSMIAKCSESTGANSIMRQKLKPGHNQAAQQPMYLYMHHEKS